jgi:hypothetical protein
MCRNIQLGLYDIVHYQQQLIYSWKEKNKNKNCENSLLFKWKY